MTERLSDVEARIGSVQQLAMVITAMQGIAAARSREARNHLAGIRASAATISAAIGEALALLPPPHPRGARQLKEDRQAGRRAVVALCAEQGFAGTFNARVLAVAQRLISDRPARDVDLLLIGDRGLMIARERGLEVAWSAPMIAHAAEAPSLADRIVDALYDRLEARRVAHVAVIHAAPDRSTGFAIVERRLVPFDFSRFPRSSAAVPPLTTLAPDVLLARLAEEYIFAELCEAVMLSFAAENEARMRAMIAARTNVARTSEELIARSRRLRQEEITSEIVELSSGVLADAETR